MTSLPLSDLRPGVVVPVGAWTDRGMVMAPYVGGDASVWVWHPSTIIERAHASTVSLDLTPPDPAGSRWDGCDVLAGMLAAEWWRRAGRLAPAPLRGVAWRLLLDGTATAELRLICGTSPDVATYSAPPLDNPRAALLAVARRELCGGGE